MCVMPTTEKQILTLVQQLSQPEQLRIMHVILNLLEDGEAKQDSPVNDQNLEIAKRRSQEYDEGKIKVLSRQEFWNKLQARQQGK